MTIIIFSLAGGLIGVLGIWVIYSYIFPLLVAKVILAALLQIFN